MKIIDFETVRGLCKSIPCTDYYDWINYALKQKADFVMPGKTRIGQPGGGVLRNHAMPKPRLKLGHG